MPEQARDVCVSVRLLVLGVGAFRSRDFWSYNEIIASFFRGFGHFTLF